ncbi:MAG: hypothetical protein WCS17_00220 [Prevotella sp.]
MKVALIIYSISWLILLAIYLYRRKESTFNWKESDSVEKFAIFLAILFAPIIILCLPYFLFTSIRDKRKSQKDAEERKKEQQIELEYRSKALASIRQAKTLGSQNNSFDFAAYLASVSSYSTTNLYTHMQDERNYPKILDLLPKLTLPYGMSLHVEKCKQQGSGDSSNLFVETPDGSYDNNIWDYINVECSEVGAWNAYILYNLWHVLPMFWHALYNRRYYLFFKEFTDYIECLQKEDTIMVRKALKQYITLPDVVKANGRFYVKCCFFTNFGGLIQETIEITIESGKATFHEIERKTLFEYQCGIMF